jgi:hypothetical protein
MSKTLRTRFALYLMALSWTMNPLHAAQESPARTLTGTYTWDEGKESGELKATFVPLAEGRWRVVFRAGPENSSHFYSGTAEGKFGQGVLQGRVQRDDDLATGSVLPFIGDLTNPAQAPKDAGSQESEEEVFTFKGEFKDGRFVGTHASVVDGKEERTGSMNLGE